MLAQWAQKVTILEGGFEGRESLHYKKLSSMRSSVFNAVNECDERTDLRATVAAYYAVLACSAGFTNARAVLDRNVGLGPWPLPRGVHLAGMTHVASVKFQGEKKSLEILYNIMQPPVGHDQRAYSTGMLRTQQKGGISVRRSRQDFTFSQYSTQI